MSQGRGLPGRRAVLLALATAPAIAAAAQPAFVEATDPMPTPLGVTAGDLKGATLHGENGERLGEIETVLATRQGIAAGLAVEIGDVVLGLGDREVLLRFDQVRREGGRVVTMLSRAQLRAQPPWGD
jgi:hypothetical protein